VVVDWVCNSWLDTPWMAGQRRQGVGVDCVNFATAVLDELASVPTPTKLSRRPQDLGLHSSWQAGASAAFWEVSHVHDLRSVTVVDGVLEVQPGDLLVHRLGSDGGAGHVSVVAWKSPAVYQALTGSGVRLCAIPAPDKIMHAWRVQDRSKWNARLEVGP